MDPSLNVNVSSPVCEPWISLKQWGHHQWDHLGQAAAVVGQHQAFCATWNLLNCWIHMEVSIGGTPIFWKVQVDGGWWVLMLIADDYAWCFMMVNNCYRRLWPHKHYIYMDMHHISNKWSSWISIDQMIITIVTFNLIQYYWYWPSLSDSADDCRMSPYVTTEVAHGSASTSCGSGLGHAHHGDAATALGMKMSSKET